MNNLTKQYLMITFAIMLLCWGSCVLCSLWGVYLSEVPPLYVLYLLGGWSPTIASFAALKKNRKIHSFREWVAITFDFKQNGLSYLLIPVLAGAFFLVLCLISRYEKGAPLGAIVVMIPMMLFGGGLEEAGWRGILQPELEKICGYTIATILTAVVWWVWHAPLFWIQGVGQYGANFLTFGIQVLGLSFALAAIKKITGSTWLCVLFHCVINSLHGVYIIRENIVGSCTAAAVLILLSYILIWIQNKKRYFT